MDNDLNLVLNTKLINESILQLFGQKQQACSFKLIGFENVLFYNMTIEILKIFSLQSQNKRKIQFFFCNFLLY
jgi:hypothetical protein